MSRILALALLASAPALAIPIFPASDEGPQHLFEGPYLGLGGGYGLELTQENVGAFDVEARAGYSFNPGLQLFLSGSLDSATLTLGPAPGPGFSARKRTLRNFQVGVNLQYHLHATANVGFYLRAIVGLGIVGPMPDINADTNGLGLSTGGGLGLEFRIAPGTYLGPELFYRHVNVTANDSNGAQYGLGADNIGLQLNLVYY